MIFFVEHFPNIVDYGFTAEMEQNLDGNSSGKKEWVSVIRNFYEPFEKELIEKGSENADLYLSVRKLRFSL